MAILYILCGAPGAGKTTWARGFCRRRLETVYISRDEIRSTMLKPTDSYFAHEDEVYDQFADSIAKTLKVGVDVIADATHLSHGSRLKLYSMLAARGLTSNMYDIIFVQLDTPVEKCLEHNARREGRERVPESVVQRMYNQSTTPKIDEFPNVKEIWVVHARDMVHQ